jgi:tRNA (guanine-N7-)-methyltransferase
MSKNKLARFAENETFSNLFQHTSYNIREEGFPMKGKWGSEYFHNDHPIVLELGCGKGEYTVGLAQRYPDKNFIGVDRKGARLWRGCKTALEMQLPNVAFLRTAIDDIFYYFAENEVSEIWITFPDPQPTKERKRLMSPHFVAKYKRFLKPGAMMHLKTDSRLLYDYIREVIPQQQWHLLEDIEDVYAAASGSASNAESNTSEDSSPISASIFFDRSVLTEIQTFYEKHWLAGGSMISYVSWRV